MPESPTLKQCDDATRQKDWSDYLANESVASNDFDDFLTLVDDVLV